MQDERNWIATATIYEVYPLTFRHGDQGGNGADRHYGNLRGVIEKLDYIKSLNVDAIWMAPIYSSPLTDGFGYNIIDHRKIHPVMGSDADFDRLVQEAHARGLKIILDMVFGHTSNQHHWFTESSKSHDNPYANFYVWADPVYDSSGAKQPPNNWLSMDLQIPSAWKWCESRGQYYLHSFNRTMPSLNISNSAVETALLDIARYWLERGADGFRLDAMTHMGHDPELKDNPVHNPAAGYHGQYHVHTSARPEAIAFLKKLKAIVDSFPERILPGAPASPYRPAMFGEAMNASEFATRLIHENILDLVFNGNLTGTLHNYRQVVEDICKNGTGVRTAWAMSSHDTTRILDRTMGAAAQPEHIVLFAGMLACLPGGIILFQGDELGLRQGTLAEVKNGDPLGLTGSFMGENDACRSGMPWLDGANDELWLKPLAINKALAPEIQEFQFPSPLNQMRELLRIRKNHPAMQSAELPLFPETYDPDVMVIVRRNSEAGKGMMCSFNFGGISKKLTLRQGDDDLADCICPPLGTRFIPFGERSKNVPEYSVHCTHAGPQMNMRFG